MPVATPSDLPTTHDRRLDSPLRRLFEPRTVAVIGAGRRRGSIGAEIFHNLTGTFTGQVVPINPHAEEIDGIRAYTTVQDVTQDIDLAVIAVPAIAVPGVIDDCIDKRVGGIVLISAGFGETGDEGRAREVTNITTGNRK